MNPQCRSVEGWASSEVTRSPGLYLMSGLVSSLWDWILYCDSGFVLQVTLVSICSLALLCSAMGICSNKSHARYQPLDLELPGLQKYKKYICAPYQLLNIYSVVAA